MKFKLLTINLILITLCLVQSGCRKKELADFTPADKPFHCYNNLLDEDETTVDAGGSCGSNGAALSSTCASPVDSIVIGIYKYKITSNIMTTNGQGYKVFTMNFTGGNLTITVNANVYYNYDLYSTFSNPDIDEYVSSLTESHYGTYSLTMGDVYIKTNGSSYAVDVCSGAFYPGGNPTSVKTFSNVN